MTTYHVANWSDHYENNRSRKVKDLAWVPIPNKHDGERYSRLMAREHAAQIFSAWILILQVASRCQPRGSLVRSDSTPHDSESLSIKTRAPQAWFDLALPVLVEMKWLTSQVVEQTSLALDCHQPATVLTSPCQHGDEERKNGMEWKEAKGISATPSMPLLELTEEQQVARARENNARGIKRTMPPQLSTADFAAAWDRWTVHWSLTFNHGQAIPFATSDNHLKILNALGEKRAIAAIETSISRRLREPAEAFTSSQNANHRSSPGADSRRPDLAGDYSKAGY